MLERTAVAASITRRFNVRQSISRKPPGEMMARESESADVVIRGMEYEHTRSVPGTYGDITLRYELMRIQQTFDAMLPRRALDVCEFSLANYLTRRGAGNHWL